MASLQGVDEALASAVPQIDPPAALRDRVMASVLGSEPAEAREPRPAAAMAQWLPLAASLVLSVGLGGYAYSLQQRIAVLEDELTGARAQAADTLARADATQRTLQAHAIASGCPDSARFDARRAGRTAAGTRRLRPRGLEPRARPGAVARKPAAAAARPHLPGVAAHRGHAGQRRAC